MPTPAMTPSPRETPERVLDVAQRLVQTRGFNGFSYADIATEIGITTAALHYHFPTKAELGRVLIERYGAAFATALASIDASGADDARKLQSYGQVYVDVMAAGRMCPCGMLAAEFDSLPEAMQIALRSFFDMNEAWLESVLDHGRQAGDLTFKGTPSDAARLFTASLEGALLLARPYRDSARLRRAARQAVEALAVRTVKGRGR